MNKVNILLTEANGNLSNEKEMIENAIKMAEEYAFSKLNIDWDIDIRYHYSGRWSRRAY